MIIKYRFMIMIVSMLISLKLIQEDAIKHNMIKMPRNNNLMY